MGSSDRSENPVPDPHGDAEPGRAEPGRTEPGRAEPGRAEPGWGEAVLPRAASPDGAAGPRWLVGAAGVGVRLLVLAVLVWLVAELATRLTLLLVAVFVGLLLAGVFDPLVRWAAGKGVPRGVGAAAAVVVVLGTIGVAAVGIGDRVEEQLPELREQVESASQELSRTFGMDISVPGTGTGTGSGSGSGSASGSGAEGTGSSSTGTGSASVGSGGSSMFGDLLSSVRVVFDVLIGFFLTLAFMFLFLKNGSAMWSWVLEKLGGRVRSDVDAAGTAAWRTTGAYMRGLTVVAAVDAVGIGVGLLLLGVPLALTLAALQFVASYIPTIGALVAGALAVAVGWVSGGASTALMVLVLVLVVQQIGNDVVEPWVMGRELPINAFVVLAAVTAGGLLWGIAGALLFVPLTAAAAAAGHELWERRGRRPLAGAD